MAFGRLSDRLSVQRHYPQDDAVPGDALLHVAAVGLVEIGNIRLLVDNAGYTVLNVMRLEHSTLRSSNGVNLVSNEVLIWTTDVIHVEGKREVRADDEHDRQKQEIAKEC